MITDTSQNVTTAAIGFLTNPDSQPWRLAMSLSSSKSSISSSWRTQDQIFRTLFLWLKSIPLSVADNYIDIRDVEVEK